MRLNTLVCYFAAAALATAADFKEFRKTVPLDANGRFYLDTYKGSIHITAWDQPQAEIYARIEADNSWMPEPVDRVEIRVDGSGASVRVKTDYRHQQFSWFGSEGSLPYVRYTIKLPRNAVLAVKDYKSDSDVAGVLGDVEFETYKGTARLDGLRGGLQLKTYKGEVRATFSAFTARSHIDTYRGTVELTLPKSTNFEIHANLQRHVSFHSDFAQTVRTTARERDFRSVVNGGGPQLHVTSYRGNIRLHSN
jgi:hypothetical protein